MINGNSEKRLEKQAESCFFRASFSLHVFVYTTTEREANTLKEIIYGYCRCSTDETKQALKRQERELKEMGATRETIYQEFISGTSDKKIQLERLLKDIPDGGVIVVTEVSRISRSTRQLLDFIEILKQRKLCLRIKNSIEIDCRNGAEIDPMTNAMLQIAGVFAELERNMISERVKSGMRAAMAKRKEHPELNPIGRPRKQYEDIPKKIKERFPDYLAGKLNKCEYARLCKVSRPTICKYIGIMMEYQEEHKEDAPVLEKSGIRKQKK